MNMNRFKAVRKDIKGCFSELLKELSENVGKIYFAVDDDALSHQLTIQKNSYEFLEKFFKKPFYNAVPLKIYITALDITELQNGLIDLSDPSLHQKEYTSTEAGNIHDENQKVLVSLKSPFSPELLSDAFTQKVSSVLKSVQDKDSDTAQEIINDFLMHYKKQVNEVVLFSEVLNLLCVSQCLYAFCYQLSQNSNFGRVMELIIHNNDSNNESYKHVLKLSERFYAVFIGNLSARVFSEQTLSIVEQALSPEEA